MNVLVTASARFAITKDQTLWTPNGSLGYSFWSRYLDVFEGVRLCVRAFPYDEPPEGWLQASGPGITPVPLPYYRGPMGYIQQARQLKQKLAAEIAAAEAIQLRVPCNVGRAAWSLLPRGRTYGVEVIGDPYDVFAPGAIKHPLRPLLRWWFPRVLRQQCAGACGGLYVTQSALQQRYPCPAYSVGASNVDLLEENIVMGRRLIRKQGPWNLIFVGTLEQLYKAPDVLIRAVAAGVAAGLDLRLTLVGDGRHRPELEALAASLGLGERVTFAGQLANSAGVRTYLDRADLFVLPSHQEGLPRAMIEAMGRALPCIGSTAGGIPELLPASDMVPPGNVQALAARIREVVTDPVRMARMSDHSLEKSRDYSYSILRERRIAFYQHVKEQTQLWLHNSHRAQMEDAHLASST